MGEMAQRLLVMKLKTYRSQAFPHVRAHVARCEKRGSFWHLGEAYAFYWFESSGNGTHTRGGFANKLHCGDIAIRAVDGQIVQY